VSNLLPIGLRGLVLAGMLSALMSALASLFNSTATLFTVDFYKRLRPQSTERHLVTVGRLATGAVVVIGMVWIPIMKSMSDQLYSYLQVVQSLLAPGIAAVFMAGIFSRRVTPRSGFIGLATGFVLGMLRLALQVLHKSGGIDFPAPLQAVVDINWLYFSFLLFAFTCAVIFTVSAFTPKASPEQLAGLTYRTVSKEAAAEERQAHGFWEVFHTCVVVGIIVAIYIYFW
jgi:SSS family solute:Na+ symporter